MNRSLATMALLATALLAGCDGGDAKGVGGVTADEAAQLNDAAEMLDASPDGLTAPEDPALEDQGGMPATRRAAAMLPDPSDSATAVLE